MGMGNIFHTILFLTFNINTLNKHCNALLVKTYPSLYKNLYIQTYNRRILPGFKIKWSYNQEIDPDNILCSAEEKDNGYYRLAVDMSSLKYILLSTKPVEACQQQDNGNISKRV